MGATRLEDPLATLRRPTVTLYDIKGAHAIFVETPAEIDVYSSELGAFFYDVQVKYAQRVMYVPMSMFYQFAASLPEPACRSILVSSTGRCGSTLVSQIMESHHSVVSVSEPFSFVSCAGLTCPRDCLIRGAGAWAAEDPEQVMEACWKVQLKDMAADRFICVKTHCQAVSIVPTIKKLFPKVLHLYLYRDPRKYVVSCIRVARAGAPSFAKKFEQAFLFRVFIVKAFDYPYFHSMGFRFGVLSLLSDEMSFAKATRYICQYSSVMMALKWVSNVRWGMKLLEVGDANTKSLHYSDLVANRRDACHRMFSFCGLPSGPANVDLALAAMSKDSQELSTLSRSAIGEEPVTFDEPGETDFLNALFKRAKLPCAFDGDLRLDCSLLG